MYTVTMVKTESSAEIVSRYFETLRAARRWAAYLMGKDYMREVRIYRGGQGGERVTL